MLCENISVIVGIISVLYRVGQIGSSVAKLEVGNLLFRKKELTQTQNLLHLS